MLQLALALLAPSNAHASACIITTGYEAIFCDGKKTASLESDDYAVITAAIKKLQDQGYKLISESATEGRKEYTLTK